MQENKFRSLIHFHFIVFIFGFTAILGSIISIESIELVWYRMLIATIFLLFFSIIFPLKKISKKLFMKLFFCGFLICMHWVFFFKAIKVSNVSITLSILSLGAFLTSFLEPFFYKTKIVIHEVILGILVAIGTIIIFRTQFHFWEGIMYASISVLLSVFFTLINGKIVGKTSSLTISFYELLSGLICISLILIFSKDLSLDLFIVDSKDFIWLFVLGTICTAYAFVISIDVMKDLSPFTLMLSINMEPVYGIILAIILLNEHTQLNSQFYFGFLLIFISIIINGFIKLKRK